MDYTIPLWGIVSIALAISWAIIKMYFKHNNMATEIKELKIEIKNQEKGFDKFKTDIEAKIDRHKIETDKKLTEINNIMIEVKTMTTLLVQDKIKK